MARRQLAAKRFEDIASQLAKVTRLAKGSHLNVSLKFDPKLGQGPMVKRSFKLLGIDEKRAGNWQLLALVALAALNLKRPGRKKDWNVSVLRSLVEIAADIYRTLPDCTEREVCEIIREVLQGAAGPGIEFPSEDALLRRLQQAKKEIHGATLRLAAAKNTGRMSRRDWKRKVEKLGVKAVYDKTTIWLSEGEKRRAVNFRSTWTNSAIAAVRKLQTPS